MSPCRLSRDRDLATLTERLGETGFRAAWDEGRAMTLEQAIEYALAVSAPREPTISDQEFARGTDPGSPGLSPLSRREREVAVLVARGQSNRQIAEALGLSKRTIDAHLRNIMGKLEVTSRSQVAAWCVAQGLLAGDRA